MLVSGDSGGPFSSRNTASDWEPDTGGVAVNSRGTLGEERHKNTGSYELVVNSDIGKFLLLRCSQFILDE